MQDNLDNQFTNNLAPQPQRPEFLKIICILSFVACGLLIITYAMGTMAMGMSEATILSVWDKVIASQPQLENVNPVEFFHEIGKVCLYNLVANCISLIGVIMMWRLNKIGFFIYVVAELVTNFLGLDIAAGEGGKSYGTMVFWIAMDIAFIVMYALNLKHMNKNNHTQAVQ